MLRSAWRFARRNRWISFGATFVVGFLCASLAVPVAINLICDDSYADYCKAYHEPQATILTVLGHAWDIVDGLITLVSVSLAGIATVFVARYTRDLNRSTKKLFVAGEQQLSVANNAVALAKEAYIADNRAWIGISDPKAVKPLTKQITPQVTHLVLPLEVSLKNHGRTPALQVAVRCDLLTPIHSGELHRDRLRDLVNAGPSNEVGVTIFPGNTVRVDALALMRGLEAEKTIKTGWPISAYLIGVVFYKTIMDETVRHTGFIYSAYDDPKTWTLEVAVPVPADEVLISDTGDGGTVS